MNIGANGPLVIPLSPAPHPGEGPGRGECTVNRIPNRNTREWRIQPLRFSRAKPLGTGIPDDRLQDFRVPLDCQNDRALLDAVGGASDDGDHLPPIG
jgi:hypothetical protein